MNSLKTRIIDRRVAQITMIQFQKLASSASVNTNSEIDIPMRKERGPTDILKALESTISRDPTAPNYKYIDDPFLIPSSLTKKRTYSLSRESGKKAAMWVLQEHADLLKSNLSEPLIEAFLPPEKYENKSQVSEEILNALIKQGRVSDVMHIYHLLEEDVSKQTKQAILELLCFYNSNEHQIPENFPEERSYQPEVDLNKNTWKNNPEIEKLFGELIQDEATAPGAYNALISGTAKYLKLDKAWNLYNECLDKNIPLSVTTYNNLIQLSPLLKDNSENRKVLLQSFLQHMTKNGVKPNIGTLNASLKSISTLPTQGVAKEVALSLLGDFKSIGVTPSLASYYYLLLIFCRQNGPTSQILLEILDELEKTEELEYQDLMDKNFFVHAMEVASKHLHDINAGDRLHKILLTKNNYSFIGGRLKESVYYRNYLHLILTSESLENFKKAYDTLVPHIYIPEPALMRDILEMLGLNEKEQAMQLLPRFLSQVVMFDMLDRHQIIKKVFELMSKHCSPPEGSPLHKQYSNMAWTVWTHIKEVNERMIQRNLWPAHIFGDMAVILLRGDEFEKMLDVLNYFAKSPDSAIGSIDENRLQEMFKACLVRGHVEGAMAALEYACEFGSIEADSMAKAIQESLPLSPTQENQLINLVGRGAIKSKSPTDV